MMVEYILFSFDSLGRQHLERGVHFFKPYLDVLRCQLVVEVDQIVTFVSLRQ